MIFILILELIWIFITYPSSLGSAHTIVGKLPKLPSNIIKLI